MKKYKELLNNIGALTLSSFGSKLLGFFLIPLYTAVLSTNEYGTYDLISTTVSLLIPLLTLNISEASLRFLLEKKYSINKIVSITLKYCLISVLLIIVLIIINLVLKVIDLFNTYFLFFLLMYLCNLFYIMMQNIVRGLDNIKAIAIGSIINSIFTLSLNLLFLLYFKLGLTGYFLSTIIANLISSIYLVFKNNFINTFKYYRNSKSIEKEMTNYSKPLMINSLAWWVNSVSDRYIVTFICGIAANGIYSISYKIPSLLSVLQSIFNQAWGISAIKEFNKDDSNRFFSNTYKIYNYLMVISCSFLIITTKLFAKVLYLNEFNAAWVYTPFLLISCVFGANSGYFGGIFSAVKNSKIIGITTLVGAVINITLNFIFILFIGTMGAAIATAISYFIIWIIRLHYVKKYININFCLTRDLIVYILLLIQSLFMIYLHTEFVYIIELILFLIINILYYDYFLTFLKKIGGKDEN